MGSSLTEDVVCVNGLLCLCSKWTLGIQNGLSVYSKWTLCVPMHSNSNFTIVSNTTFMY